MLLYFTNSFVYVKYRLKTMVSKKTWARNKHLPCWHAEYLKWKYVFEMLHLCLVNGWGSIEW